MPKRSVGARKSEEENPERPQAPREDGGIYRKVLNRAGMDLKRMSLGNNPQSSGKDEGRRDTGLKAESGCSRNMDHWAQPPEGAATSKRAIKGKEVGRPDCKPNWVRGE